MIQKNLLCLTIVITLFGCQKVGQSPTTLAEEKTNVCSYEIVATYPHDPKAFTQGLIFDDGELYESTGLRGQSTLRKVDLETGKVLQKEKLDDRYFGEGLTLWEDRLIQLTWVSNKGIVYDRETLEEIQTFTYPTQGWGLTHNKQELILSDGSDILYFLDPDTYEEVKQIQVTDEQRPVDKLNELEFINGEIWANVWLSDRIARIDPETGNVLGWIDLTGIIDPVPTPKQDAVLNGIAYDAESERLFVTGKLWSKLFEIEPVCEGTVSRTWSEAERSAYAQIVYDWVRSTAL
ncbi:MAG: glutaminyl-peptide cyclotransferase [Cyanobacteria bacterium J06598_4]